VILSIFLNLKSYKYFLRKMGSKKARDLLFLLYSSVADLGKQEKTDHFVIFTRYFRLQNVILKKYLK
jgi:hypothetical protein